jgi:uncharacterized protein (DUF4415 family)
MSGADISKHGRKSSTRKRLERLAERPDSEIDLSEIPEMTEKQLSRMVPLQDYLDVRRKKERLTVRIDKDVVAWLRSGGEGYQTRLNDILRNAMTGSRKAGK